MSNVLLFPARNQGRVRKSQSREAMGRCSIGILERFGEAVPANVADIRRTQRGKNVVEDGRLALRLSLAIFAMLDAEQKESILDAILMYARHDDGPPGDECRALYPCLTGEQLPC